MTHLFDPDSFDPLFKDFKCCGFVGIFIIMPTKIETHYCISNWRTFL